MSGRTHLQSKFSRFDGRRVAVVLPLGPESRTFCGRAVYTTDSQLGNVLRIRPDGCGEGDAEILISESEWEGLVVPDRLNECDFCFFQVPSDEN